MDAEDASMIESKLRKIVKDEKTINENLWQQVTNNNDIIVNFNNMSLHFSKEQKKLKNILITYNNNNISKELVEKIRKKFSKYQI